VGGPAGVAAAVMGCGCFGHEGGPGSDVAAFLVSLACRWAGWAGAAGAANAAVVRAAARARMRVGLGPTGVLLDVRWTGADVGAATIEQRGFSAPTDR
jgi:hypothetical protein